MSNGTPSPFPIVVLGDSIQWGQGLRPGVSGAPSDKMAELVGATLATNSTVVTGWTGGAGLSLSVLRFAHSSATINGALPASASGPVPVSGTTAFPAGEVPATPSTILDQIRGAPAALASMNPPVQASSVPLVILDGGINDVGVFGSILNPFTAPGAVAAMANAACGGTLITPGAAAFFPAGTTTGRMSTLLTLVGTSFPNAVIVVTGYYDILSPFSALTGLIVAVGFLSGSVVPELLLPGGWLAAALAGTMSASSATAGVIANCVAFRATSNASLASAVALANAAPGGTFTAGSLSAPRFLFVPSPFTPVNALFTGGSNGADETTLTAPAFLWGFNPSLATIGSLIDSSVVAGSVVGGIFGFLGGGIVGSTVGSTAGALAGAAVAITAIMAVLAPVDEVAAPRAGVCGGALVCNLASVGHPNIEGEKAYAGAIAPPLITLFGTTLPAIGVTGVITAVSQGCLIATAALGSPQAAQVDRIRRLRDEVVARSRLGREVVAATAEEYYAFSPVIAARMRSSVEVRERVRRFVVSPLLGFGELLTRWAAAVDDQAFVQTLARTLDASLEDLACGGIAAGSVGAAANEIARLNVGRARKLWQRTEPHAAEKVELAELGELVSYFNAVSSAKVPAEGRYVNVLLLEPLKLYWELLRDRAAGTPLASNHFRFATGLSRWVTDVAALVLHTGLSVADVGADVRMLADLFGAKQSSRQVFEASLGRARSSEGKSHESR